MKIQSVGAGLFHGDGRTYLKKLIVAFRNLANAPESYKTKSNRNTIPNRIFCA